MNDPDPTANPPPSLGLRPGTEVGEWRVLRPLGEGAMARVYAVEHVEDGTVRALKVLKLPHESIRNRLLTEGRAQMRLRHPNIVAVHAIVEVGGSPGLIMDLVEGTDLQQQLEIRPPPLPEADRMAKALLEAMAYAHEHQVIHRDLKPANVLLAGGKVPRVTDFGLARLVDQPDQDGRATRSGVAMGTPCYMAPEQIRNAKGVDARADVYSLGALLYELVSGQRAYPGDDMLEVLTSVAKGARKPIQEVAPRAPSRMQDAIEGALALDVHRRIPDVRTLLAVWNGERRWGQTSPATETLVPAPKTSSWTWALAMLPLPMLVGAGALLVLGVGVIGWMLLPRTRTPLEPVPVSAPQSWDEGGAASPVRTERRRGATGPVNTAPTPIEPSPAPDPGAPEPPPDIEPVAPPPAPNAAEPARLSLRGSYRSALLLGGSREHPIDGPIPPGSYTLQATFHEGSVYELAIRFLPGERVVVQCDPGWKECSRSSP